MVKISKVYEGTDPGANLGRTFTASIGQEEIVPEGQELSYLRFGLRGAVSTAAVPVETFAGVLSEYTLRVGAETRILASFRDLIALSAFYYGQVPTIGENTDGTGNDYIGNVKVPVYAKVDPSKPITHAATRTAVTNISSEELAITAYWDAGEQGRAPVHAVKIDHTTAGSAGYETLGFRIAPVGRLIGLILRQANPLNDGNVDVSVQRVRFLANGQMHSQFNVLADGVNPAEVNFNTPSAHADLLRDYTMLDLRPSGIDTKAQEITLQLDVEDVSDNITILPVIEMA